MSMFNTAFLYLTIPQVYILDALFPFFVLVLGGHFLKDGIRASDIIALILGAIAIAVLNPMGFQTQAGVSLIFVEVVLYALMLVYMRKQGAEYTFKSTFWMFLFASLFLAPFPVIYGFGSLSTSWHWVALLGFGTGLGYICFNYALMRIKSQTMNIMLILGTTIFGFLTAVLVFKEVLATKFLIGSGLLLFAGVFLKYMRGFGKGRLAKIVYYAGSKKAKLLQRE
jgi:drug/metabolite transporter (DMT)-like permease